MTTVWQCFVCRITVQLNRQGGCSHCGTQAVYVEHIPVIPVVETENRQVRQYELVSL